MANRGESAAHQLCNRISTKHRWLSAILTSVTVLAGCGEASAPSAASTPVSCHSQAVCRSLVASSYHLRLQVPERAGLTFLSGQVFPAGGGYTDMADLSYLDTTAQEHFSVSASTIQQAAIPLGGRLDPTACPTNSAEEPMHSPGGRTVCIRSGPVGQPANRTLKMTVGTVIYLIIPAVRTAASPEWLMSVADSIG